jgi:transposase
MQHHPYVLGVDVSKKTLAMCLMDARDRSILTQNSIPNKENDVRRFLSAAPVDSMDTLCVAVEPTGRYWYVMADTALASGCKVVSAPPRAAKKFLQSVNLRAKTDKLDAKGIALYASTMELHDYTPKPEALRTLDELLSLRRNLSQTVALYTQLSDSDRAGDDILREVLQAVKAQLRDLDKRIAQVQTDVIHAKRLRTVPGFGPVVSGSLASRLTTYSFKHSDSFVAYIGLDLRISDSGKKRGRRTLTKNGDPELRRLLYLAAQSAIKVKDSPFAKIYHTHRERGLTSTEAICVVARKLARTAWSIVRFETEYDPDRVFQDKKIPKNDQETKEQL